jgi:hypothetical protein
VEAREWKCEAFCVSDDAPVCRADLIAALLKTQSRGNGLLLRSNGSSVMDRARNKEEKEKQQARPKVTLPAA